MYQFDKKRNIWFGLVYLRGSCQGSKSIHKQLGRKGFFSFLLEWKNNYCYKLPYREKGLTDVLYFFFPTQIEAILVGSNVDRTWKIKFSQIECGNPNRPDKGCHKWLTGASGNVKSYNFQQTAQSEVWVDAQPSFIQIFFHLGNDAFPPLFSPAISLDRPLALLPPPGEGDVHHQVEREPAGHKRVCRMLKNDGKFISVF